MRSDKARLNIILPKKLVQEVDTLAGERRRSAFIADAIRKQIELIHRAKTFRLLEEGYRANKRESAEIAKQFETVNLEGWDEY